MAHAVIIDDNAQNVDVLARLLAQQGVSCTKVSRPRLLDTILQDVDQIDLIFLDLEMPDANGYEVLNKLKSDDFFRSVPIVAYTVHVSELTEAHQGGFHSFIGKPIDAEKFPDQLERILHGEHVWETQ